MTEPVLTHRMHTAWTTRRERGRCPVCGLVSVRQRTWHLHVTLDTPLDVTEKGLRYLYETWVPDFTHQRCQPLTVEKVPR